MKGIQIIGTQRSGSNLLRLMLNEHPAICAPHPPHILATFMPHLKKYGSLDDPIRFETLIEDTCQLVESNPVPWAGVKLDRDIIRSRCRVNSMIEVFRVIYELKAEKSEKQFWCCKSMVNFMYFSNLESSGVRPYYLHLVRDGRDVASSFRKTSIGEKHIYHLARQWKHDQQMSNRIIAKVGQGRGLRIHYEDLIRFPEKTIAKVFNWLGIDFHDSVLRYYLSGESALTASGGEMWANLRKPILSNNSWKFTNELLPHEISIFEAVSGRDLENYDYRLINRLNLGKKFTEVEIADFDCANSLLKNEAVKRANPNDLKKRLPQQRLKAKIADRDTFQTFQT